MNFQFAQVTNKVEESLNGVDFSRGEELVIPLLETHLSQEKLLSLSPFEEAHWIAVINWLMNYTPEPNATHLEQVRGYIEACYHLCELSEWKKASKILFLETSSLGGTKELHEQLFIWGYYQEQIDLYSRLIERVNQDLDCLLLYGLGRAYEYLGQTNSAIYYHQWQLRIATEIGNQSFTAKAHGGLERVYSWHIGQHETAFSHAQAQLKIAREISDPEQEIAALRGISDFYGNVGNYRNSLQYLNQALEIAREIDSVGLEGEISGDMGQVYLNVGSFKKSVELFQRQLGISYATGNPYQEWLALYGRGWAYLCLENYELAIECSLDALKNTRELGNRIAEMSVLQKLGVIYARIGKHETAIEFFQLELKLILLTGNKFLEACTRANLSYCYGCLKQPEAFSYAQDALKLADKQQSRRLKSFGLQVLASAHWHQGAYLTGLFLLTKSFFIVPPWKDSTSRFVFKRLTQLIVKLVNSGSQV